MPWARKNTRAEVGDGNAHSHRALPGEAGDGHQTAHPLSDLIDSRPITIGAALPEPGDAAVDQPRIERAQALVVDSEAPLDVGAVVLHHDIAIAYQLLEDGHALWLSQVQGQAALVAMQVLEVEAVAVTAHAITRAPAGHLDLDGPGTPIHQLPHTGRARPSAGEIEDREPSQGKRAAVVSHAGQSPSVGLVQAAGIIVQPPSSDKSRTRTVPAPSLTDRWRRVSIGSGRGHRALRAVRRGDASRGQPDLGLPGYLRAWPTAPRRGASTASGSGRSTSPLLAR